MKLVKSLAFLTIVALPAYIIRCKSFAWCASPIPFTLIEILILTTTSAWVVWLIYSIKKNKDSLKKLIERIRGPLILPIILFLASATISLFVTADLRGGLGIWKAYFIEGALLYLVVVDISLKEKDYFWVIKALLFSGFLVSVFSMFKFIFLIGDVGLDKAFNTRVSGIYEFANAIPLYLGPIIALSVSVIVSQYRRSQTRIIFYLSVLSFLFMILAIFLSQSKGGIIGIFSILVVWVGFMIYKSLSNKFKIHFKYLLILAAVSYFLFSVLVYMNIDSLVPKGKYLSNSVINRYCIWQGARDLLNEKPVTGSGLNGFHLDYEGYKTCLKADYQYPHNILLTFWVETGLVGLIAFAWIAYVYIRISSKGVDEVISVGLLAALVYIFIHGLVDVPFFKNDLSAQFWLLVALVSINHSRG